MDLRPLTAGTYRILERRGNFYIVGDSKQSALAGAIEWAFVHSVPFNDVLDIHPDDWQAHVDQWAEAIPFQDILAIASDITAELQEMNDAQVSTEGSSEPGENVTNQNGTIVSSGSESDTVTA